MLRAALVAAVLLVGCGRTDEGCPLCGAAKTFDVGGDYTRITCTLVFPSRGAGPDVSVTIDDLMCEVEHLSVGQ